VNKDIIDIDGIKEEIMIIEERLLKNIDDKTLLNLLTTK
jgi:hypothetical protein